MGLQALAARHVGEAVVVIWSIATLRSTSGKLENGKKLGNAYRLAVRALFLEILNELCLVRWRTSAARLDANSAIRTLAMTVNPDHLRNVRVEQAFLSRAFG